MGLLTAAAIERGDLPLRFPFDRPVFEICPLVALFLALAHPELDLYPRVLPVKAQRDERESLNLGAGEKLVEFEPVKEETPRALGFVLLVARLIVGLNVHIVEPGLAILDPGKRAVDVAMPGPDGLYLGSLQLDAGFQLVEDMVIPQGFAVNGNLTGHG